MAKIVHVISWGFSADRLGDNSHMQVVRNYRVGQAEQTAVPRREMRLREGLEDACNRVSQLGFTKKSKGVRVLGVQSGRRLMCGRMRGEGSVNWHRV